MQRETANVPISKGARIGGWIMSILPALFLIVDGGAKLRSDNNLNLERATKL